jgi:hypothetical protein
LITLELKYPYAGKTTKDTAKFLRELATPKLHHLTLAYCDFDDDCAEVLGSCPGLGNLTRLVLDQATLSTKAAKKLLRSPNLQRLVELCIEPRDGEAQTAFGKAVELLLDPTIMPLLARGWFSTTGVAEVTIERLQEARPGVVISQW